MINDSPITDHKATIFPLVLHKILFISTLPFAIFLLLGLSNFGLDFFSTAVWTESLGRRINPTFSGAAVALFLCAVMFNIFDVWKSRPSYVGTLENYITIRGRKVCDIGNIDISNAKQRGLFGSIIEIPVKDNGKSIYIPLIYTNLKYEEAIELLRTKITDF
jgi:hypothetical protein